MAYPQTVTVFKSGNSLVVTIPRRFSYTAKIKPGARLYCDLSPDGLLTYGTTYAAVTSTRRTRRQRRRS